MKLLYRHPSGFVLYQIKQTKIVDTAYIVNRFFNTRLLVITSFSFCRLRNHWSLNGQILKALSSFHVFSVKFNISKTIYIVGCPIQQCHWVAYLYNIPYNYLVWHQSIKILMKTKGKQRSHHLLRGQRRYRSG